MVEKQDYKYIIRVCNTDLDGSKQIYSAMRKIKGVSYALANAICNVIDLDKTKKAGALNPEEVKKIESVINDPKKYNLPKWLFNRQKDYESGDDKHLIGVPLKLQKEMDLKRLKKIKSYRGMRHAYGLPVRGQRTRGHFRHGKTVGVQRKAAKMAKSGGKKK